MFKALPLIAERLRTSVGVPWDVAHALEPHDKRGMPRVTVLMPSMLVGNTSGAGVTLKPAYPVQLVGDLSQLTAEQLDCAFDAVIGALHNWVPDPERIGRKVDGLRLDSMRAMDFAEQQLAGFELIFTTTTTRQGCSR